MPSFPKFNDDYEKVGRLLHSRFIFIFSILLILSSVLIIRLYYLQVVHHEYYLGLSKKNYLHIEPIEVNRGLISDRNGLIIAEDRPTFNLTLNLKNKELCGHLLRNILDILALSQEKQYSLSKVLTKNCQYFKPVDILQNLNEYEVARIAVNKFRLPGIEITTRPIRYYPEGSLFSHAVGYVGRTDHSHFSHVSANLDRSPRYVGQTGVEHFYEKELRGYPGTRELEKDANARVKRVIKEIKPIPGKDIVLTLDSNLQRVAEKALSGRKGAVVALNPKNGEILAMVSQPSFNPNLFITGINSEAYYKIRNSKGLPLFNRVSQGTYPPGSAIKPAIAIAGLDSGSITPSLKIYDRGYYQLPNSSHKYRNWNHVGEGYVNLDHAIMRSNDTYFYNLAHVLGIDALSYYMKKFGLGSKISLDISGEVEGLMPSREWKYSTRKETWFPGETLILGIGQGYMQVTPIQLVQAISLIANRGKWIRPHLAKSIAGKVVSDSNPIPDIELKDPMDWIRITNSMLKVMHDPRGTGSITGRKSKYLIAGKSATSQVISIPQNENYHRSKIRKRYQDHALFVGFAPAYNPEITVLVIVENGGSGSRVAAPVMLEVMNSWLLNSKGELKKEYNNPLKPSAYIK